MNIVCRGYHRLFLGKISINELNKEQRVLTEKNISKHTKIFFSMIAVMAYTFFVVNYFYFDSISSVMTALLGVLFVSGTAWFAITFGAIPSRYMDFAIQTTAYLFTTFAFSASAVFVASSIALPLLTPIFFIAFITLYAASVKYDIVDALKMGIDETIYKHAKVGRTYFIRELKKSK